MKKLASLLIALILAISCLPLVAFAQDGAGGELENISPNGLAYCSSEKNTLWTPAKALNDGQHSADTWQGWECAYPTVPMGAITTAGFSGEYCGIKFTNHEYYEIHKINMNVGLHSALGGQNAHYKVQFLVEGVWVTVLEFNDSDTTPTGYASYEQAMANDTSYYHIGSNYSFELETPVTTNNVRITLSDYAKNYPGGDVLIFPYIYEIELMGKLGETPDIELPEGAVVSTNIGYHSFPEASSSFRFMYPYRAIDGDTDTCWSPKDVATGEELMLRFTSPKAINSIKLISGEYMEGIAPVNHPFDLMVRVDGTWQTLATLNTFDEANLTYEITYNFETVLADAVKIVFKGEASALPKVYELEAHLATEKTYYLENRYTSIQRISASKGNLAFMGTPYASHNMQSYSEPIYINDGDITPTGKVWFSGVMEMPVYCGVSFIEAQTISKLALYTRTPIVEGTDILSFEIQALVNGDYQTLLSGESYHEQTKYMTVYEFDEVTTTDIRIVFTRGSGTFANVLELELYAPDNAVCKMFDGIVKMADTPEVYVPSPEQDPEQSPNGGQGDGNDEEPPKDNTATVIIIVAVGVLLLGAGAAVLVILKKKKSTIGKEEKTEENKEV